MPDPRYIAVTILVGITITAHFALAKQAEWNGTFSLEYLLSYTNRILPNTNIPIKLPQTGIAGIDNYFAFMDSFFYITLDSRNIRAHWQGNHLIGSLSSIWVVMLLEAHQSHRSAAFMFMTYFLEVMGELLGIGLFTPIWSIVHLFMTSDRNPKRNPSSLKPLGYALLLGYCVPSILMLRTKPDAEGPASQQFWTIARLFHPIFVFVVYKVLSIVTGRQASTTYGVSSRRTFYLFSILASAFFHVTSLAYLLAPHMFPDWVTPEVTAALDPATVLIPVPFWPEQVVTKVDLSTGVAIFLQWDWMCSSAAIVIWATALYSEVATKASRAPFEIAVQSVLVGVLAGPAAVAAWLMAEREAVLQTETSVEKKIQ